MCNNSYLAQQTVSVVHRRAAIHTHRDYRPRLRDMNACDVNERWISAPDKLQSSRLNKHNHIHGYICRHYTYTR